MRFICALRQSGIQCVGVKSRQALDGLPSASGLIPTYKVYACNSERTEESNQ